jgi:hypothetical protein
MRFLRIMMPVALAAGVLCGQDKAPEKAPDKPAETKPEYDAVIIPVTTLTGDSFNRLVQMLNVFGVQFRGDDKLRVILVYAPMDVVEKMKKVVAALDRPGSEAAIGRNIDMTLSFLKCSTKASGQPSALPADLEPVARQLRTAMQYKDVELLDTVPLHLQEGRVPLAQETMRLPSGNPGNPATGTISIQVEGVTHKDQGRYVRFSSLSFKFKFPGSSFDVGFNTSGDFMEGQKTVLGKLSGMDDDSAIFVVVALKVLD